MSWCLVDPKDGAVIPLTTSDAANATRGSTWMGKWWWVLEFFASGVAFRATAYKPFGGGQPTLTVPLAIPPTPGNYQPQGITNDGKRLVISSRDSAATSPDRFVYYDTNGALIREIACSDSPDRDNKQITFMGHHFYVVTDMQPASPRWYVKKYDLNGKLLQIWQPTGTTSSDVVSGITNDGHDLYIVITSSTTRMERYSPRGVLQRVYPTPGGTKRFLNGLTFNGRHLIARITL